MVAALELLPVALPPSSSSSNRTTPVRLSSSSSSSSSSRLAPNRSHSRLLSGRARNTRVDTVLNACKVLQVQVRRESRAGGCSSAQGRVMVVLLACCWIAALNDDDSIACLFPSSLPQAAVADTLEQQHDLTLASAQMQPYRRTEQVLRFCTAFDAGHYIASQPTARQQLLADVESLGSWLAELSTGSHHISISSSSTGGDNSCQAGAQNAGSMAGSPRASASYSLAGGSSSSSGSGCGGASAGVPGSPHHRRRSGGLVEFDVAAVRPVLIKTGRAAFG